MLLPFGEAAQRILDDDDRAIDDQPEIERAQAHQIARDAEPVHARCRHQHGDRDDRGGDERRADIAEQQEQHDDDEQRAFDQVLLDRRDGRIDQLGAVIDRLGEHVGRQRLVDLVELLGRTVATMRLFSPTSISTVEITASDPMRLPEPVRTAPPITTWPTSFTRTGTPARVATTAS
jgi:hypothetical protein